MSSRSGWITVTRVPAHVRAVLGVALLALWLGWVVPLLYSELPAGDAPLSAADILEQLRLQPLPVHAAGPLLLRIAPRCACNKHIPALLPAIATHDLHSAAPRLPYPWVLLDGSRLVYAGPALLDAGCGTRPQSAAPLVQRLLEQPQDPMIIQPRCACQKE
jgi:hypothetical protein